jgi:hypothetical protein
MSANHSVVIFKLAHGCANPVREEAGTTSPLPILHSVPKHLSNQDLLGQQVLRGAEIHIIWLSAVLMVRNQWEQASSYLLAK